MNSFPIATLNENTFFTQELVLDKQFILLDPSCPFTNSMKKALTEWGIKVVYSEGSITGSRANAAPINTENFQQVDIADVNTTTEKKSEMGENIRKLLRQSHENISGNEKSRMGTVQNIYNEYSNYINSIYTHYATHKVLNYQEISDTVKELCVFIKDNRRYVLRIQPANDGKNKNFIINHSMRSTVIAIVIGLQLMSVRILFSPSWPAPPSSSRG